MDYINKFSSWIQIYPEYQSLSDSDPLKKQIKSRLYYSKQSFNFWEDKKICPHACNGIKLFLSADKLNKLTTNLGVLYCNEPTEMRVCRLLLNNKKKFINENIKEVQFMIDEFLQDYRNYLPRKLRR